MSNEVNGLHICLISAQLHYSNIGSLDHVVSTSCIIIIRATHVKINSKLL